MAHDSAAKYLRSGLLHGYARMSAVLLVAAVRVTLAAKDPNRTLVHEWPMIMAHDSATTYLRSGLLHPINRWGKTQPDGGLPGLLDCGARAFDWRPTLLTNGTLAMHHAFDIIEKSMDEAVDDMLAWAAAMPNTPENLAVLGVTDCTCQDTKAQPCQCQDRVDAFLQSKNISSLTADELQRGVTVADAMKLGARSKGGAAVLAIHAWVPHYEPRVTCSGYRSGGSTSRSDGTLPSLYTCYADSSSKAFPLNRMYEYIGNVTRMGPDSNRSFGTVQALWEEDAASVAIGTLHGSSLMKDETKSNLNHLLTQRIKSGLWNVSQVGMIEINNVCDGGAELLAAFREAAMN